MHCLRIAPVVGILALLVAPPFVAQAAEDCATYQFDEAHPKLILKSESAVWRIENKGPADVILYVEEDDLVAKVLGRGESTLFLGDKNYTYSLFLQGGKRAARVRVCPPSR